jgi:hypothetical protein
VVAVMSVAPYRGAREGRDDVPRLVIDCVGYTRSITVWSDQEG